MLDGVLTDGRPISLVNDNVGVVVVREDTAAGCWPELDLVDVGLSGEFHDWLRFHSDLHSTHPAHEQFPRSVRRGCW
jgi:hypothetical protein